MAHDLVPIGDRPAIDDAREIEVTPEMIEAGRLVLLRNLSTNVYNDISEHQISVLLRDLYESMSNNH